MFVLRVLVLISIMVLAFGIVTQLLIPLIQRTLLFPAFRKKAKLQDELMEVAEAEEVLEIQHEIDERRQRLAAKAANTTPKGV